MSGIAGVIIIGLASAALYAVAASGLVVTYTTSGIFNFAHGAVAMMTAFVYWQLSSPDAWGLPVPVALVLSIGVFAPGLGLVIERVLMRGLYDASPITRLVVPIGLLVALIQIATVIWPPATVNARLPRYFPGQNVDIFGVVVEYHQLVIVATAILVAIGLRIILYNTRVGVAMRAVVDNRDLASLNGVDPRRVSALAWALGCGLAGVAGVLIAPILSLDQTQLTFLVINAYAAAMVGRLRSLSLTVVGAIILGIGRQAATYYQSDLPSWITTETVPVLMLFIVLVVVPQDKATLFNTRPDRSRVPNPSVMFAVVAAVALVAMAFVTPTLVHGTALQTLGYGLCLSIIALSLVPLTGYAGQISLAPLAFAGIGALLMYWWGGDGNPLALLAAALVCAVVGALVALPTIRLKGLYLALSTMAFALFCEQALFTKADRFRDSNADFDRLQLGPISTSSDRANLVLIATVFALMGVGLTLLRRGRLGRRLQAMKDSPAAASTLGLNMSVLKLEVFALSAAIAGVGGALLGGWRGKAGPDQFALLQGNLPALPLVLMAVVGGIAAVAGALLGGMLLAVMPLIGNTIEPIRNLMIIAPGLAGISLASNPDGAIAQTVVQVRASLQRRRGLADKAIGIDARGATGPGATMARIGSLLLPPRAGQVPEEIPVGGGTTAEQVAVLDGELGLDWGRCHGDS